MENENEQTGDTQANVACVEECDDTGDVSIDINKWENGADDDGYDDRTDCFLVEVFQASDLNKNLLYPAANCLKRGISHTNHTNDSIVSI